MAKEKKQGAKQGAKHGAKKDQKLEDILAGLMPDPNEAPPVPDPQSASPFFKLPPEIRNEIYALLFSSTRFAHGERQVSAELRIKIAPAPHGLALISTCRRARCEIGDSWLSRSLFSFETTESMLDKLAPLTPETLAKIRHVRVRADSFNIQLPHEDSPKKYELPSVLKLLPGLQLDQLTVLGCPYIADGFNIVDKLIKGGNGWKTLRYISHGSDSDKYVRMAFWPRPLPAWIIGPVFLLLSSMPATWQLVLEGRDGVSSVPAIIVYRSLNKRGGPGQIFNPDTHVRCEKKPYKNVNRRDVLSSLQHRGKELMVVVERGECVDYRENGDSPPINGGTGALMPGMTWADMRHYIVRPENRHDDDGLDCQETVRVDTYEEVDEYVWTWEHEGT